MLPIRESRILAGRLLDEPAAQVAAALEGVLDTGGARLNGV
jgi:hypothetical protein